MPKPKKKPQERSLLRSCATKTKYGSEKHAKKVAARCMQDRDVDLRPYYCALCLGWHLTKTERLVDRLDRLGKEDS